MDATRTIVVVLATAPRSRLRRAFMVAPEGMVHTSTMTHKGDRDRTLSAVRFASSHGRRDVRHFTLTRIEGTFEPTLLWDTTTRWG